MKAPSSKRYEGKHLDQVAFPLGGTGAGMFCLEGTGALGSMSLRNAPDVFHEPEAFSALYVKQGGQSCAKVIQGPVPRYKVFHTQIGVRNRLDGGRRRVKKYLWSFVRTAPAGAGQAVTCSTSGMGLRLK